MLTSAKLIGGIFLAFTAGYISFIYLGNTPSVNVGPKYLFVNAIIGFIVGWRSIGSDPGFGGMDSIMAGFRGIILFIFLSAVIFGIWVVIVKLQGFFIKSFENVFTSWIDASMIYLKIIWDPNVLLVLAIGGAVSGIASGLANRFWS